MSVVEVTIIFTFGNKNDHFRQNAQKEFIMHLRDHANENYNSEK